MCDWYILERLVCYYDKAALQELIWQLILLCDFFYYNFFSALAVQKILKLSYGHLI